MRDYVYVKGRPGPTPSPSSSLEGVYNGHREGHTTSEVLKAVAEAALKTPDVVHAPAPPGTRSGGRPSPP